MTPFHPRAIALDRSSRRAAWGAALRAAASQACSTAGRPSLASRDGRRRAARRRHLLSGAAPGGGGPTPARVEASATLAVGCRCVVLRLARLRRWIHRDDRCSSTRPSANFSRSSVRKRRSSSIARTRRARGHRDDAPPPRRQGRDHRDRRRRSLSGDDRAFSCGGRAARCRADRAPHRSPCSRSSNGCAGRPGSRMKRIGVISVHTCPGRARRQETGGMNVYVREVARHLGGWGSRSTSSREQTPGVPTIVPLGWGARVVHIDAGRSGRCRRPRSSPIWTSSPTA